MSETICTARYEPVEVEPDDTRTHTCALPSPHPEQPHRCPRCGSKWTVSRPALSSSGEGGR